MGNSGSALRRRNYRLIDVVIDGIDRSGKTSIFYQLTEGTMPEQYTPTIGLNLEQIHRNGLNIKLHDVGGMEKIRGLWAHRGFMEQPIDIESMIFVVDSTDRERLSEARQYLHRPALGYIEDLFTFAPLLVFANKKDLPGCLSEAEIAEALGIQELKEKWGCIFPVQGCSALDGRGLKEGLAWLVNELQKPSHESPWEKLKGTRWYHAGPLG